MSTISRTPIKCAIVGVTSVRGAQPRPAAPMPQTLTAGSPHPAGPDMPHNDRSRNVTQGVARSANRAMYYAMGYRDQDFERPMIGVANAHSTITPCNSGLQRLADAAIEQIAQCDANSQVFGVPTVSDGIGMGTEGMKYSLVSREVIADTIETCVNGQWMDGADRDRRLRQEHAGCHDGDRTLQRAGDLRVRRHRQAGPLQGRGPDHRFGVRGGRRVHRRAHRRGGLQADRAALHPGLGVLRRHVHGQHDELVVRGARHEPAVFLDHGQPGPGKGRQHGRIGQGPGGRRAPRLEADATSSRASRSRTPSAW